jgi:putative hydrolase of the HAD superfamily
MRAQRNSPPSAVFLDALGTLVHLEEPWPALAELMLARHGVSVSLDEARRAMLIEMAHYRANCVHAGDATSLARLRLECAAILSEQLAASAIDAAALVPTLLDSLRFSAYDDVVPSLERWRAAGIRPFVVSNWDISLHDVLAVTELRELLDGVVCSADVGLSKPDPAPFAAALELAGVAPEAVVHIGDSLEEDVAGARAVAIEAVLVHRGVGAIEPPAGLRVIASLREW